MKDNNTQIESFRNYREPNGTFHIELESKGHPSVSIKVENGVYSVNGIKIDHTLYMTIWEIVYSESLVSIRIDEILELIEKHKENRITNLDNKIRTLKKLVSEIEVEFEALKEENNEAREFAAEIKLKKLVEEAKL